MTVRNRDDRDEARSEAFRCPECEANTGTGGLCAQCRMERDAPKKRRERDGRSAP